MKKTKMIARLLAVVMLVTALVIPMTSCSQTSRLLGMGEAERAAYFFDLVDMRASSAASFSMTQKMSMKLDIGDMAYEQEGKATITFIGEKDDFTYLEQVETTVWSAGEKIEFFEDSGYIHGMMFVSYDENGTVTKLKSPITPEEYNAFKAESTADDPETRVGEGFCDTMTCVRNDDKTWTATYEGFTAEGMKPFTAMLDGFEHTVTADHALVDIRLTYVTDADFYPISSKVEFIFEENKEAETRVPTIVIENTYTGWNNTVLGESFLLTGYTEVEDVRHVQRFLQALRDRKSAEFGSFTIHTESDIVYGEEREETVFDYEVTFKNMEDYEFNYRFTEEGYDYDLSYKKGDFKTVVRENGTIVYNETTPMTDSEAQSTVSQLMDSEQISGVDLADMEVVDAEKGIYRFKLSNNLKNKLDYQYEMLYGTTCRNANGTLEVTMVDGKLMSYKYHVYCTLMVEDTLMSVQVDMTVTFKEVIDESTSV